MIRFFLILFIAILPLDVSLCAEEAQEGPFVIHDLALDPENPETVYGITSNYGVLKSPDGGKTWNLSNRGLRSYTHHALVVDPKSPNTLYVGAWGGGISKSVDRGFSWTSINERLGNTAIEKIAIDASNTEMIYAVTTSGVFRSENGGALWFPFSEGLPVSEVGLFQDLFVIQGPLPPESVGLFLSSDKGLFGRRKEKGAWEKIPFPVEGIHPTKIVRNPKTGVLYLGTLKKGLWHSRDRGKTWERLSEGLEESWISDIAIIWDNPDTLYVSTRKRGILKSRDGGRSWKEINRGIPGIDVRCLVVNPRNTGIIYAGTPHDGVLKTMDGGSSWVPLKGFPVLKMSEIIRPLDRWPEKSGTQPVNIPAVFNKCNRCHGWADPYLNAKPTYWRVPANRRDWGPTLERMRVRARLTPEEEGILKEFLASYTKPRSPLLP